jgi:hypothetical protein
LFHPTTPLTPSLLGEALFDADHTVRDTNIREATRLFSCPGHPIAQEFLSDQGIGSICDNISFARLRYDSYKADSL